MKAAGLKAIDTVVESTAVLVKSKNSKHPMVELLTSRIRGVISMFNLPFNPTPQQQEVTKPSPFACCLIPAAHKYVLCEYNIPRTELATACKITPGKRAPTVTALEEEGWVAVSAMVEKKEIATVMDELIKIGGTDILVLNIANSRTF